MVVIIFIAGSWMYRSKIFASNLGGGDQQLLDLGSDFGKKNVWVIFSNNSAKIEIEKNLFSSCSFDLTGFQTEAKIVGTVQINNKERAIEISGPAGAHSENRQYFIIDMNYCPKPLSFVKNNGVSYNIYSDEPSFVLQDFNADGIIDLAVEFRNYDLDPIVDLVRDIYLLNNEGHQFVFQRSEVGKYQLVD